MQKIGILPIFILFFNLASAQQPMQTRKLQDEESSKIIKELQNKMLSYSTISIEFTVRSEKNDKVIDEMKGSTLIKGNKYTLITTEQQIFCDGVTLWNYLPQQKEVTISLYNQEDDATLINPLMLIRNYEKQYTSDFIRESVEKGVVVQIIDLTPRKATSYYKVRLVLDKDKKQIMRVTIYEKEKMQFSYIVTKFVVNQVVADSRFTFDTSKHTDIEVVDIRE
jgi:outer membrane lipoprotein-sorting protein